MNEHREALTYLLTGTQVAGASMQMLIPDKLLAMIITANAQNSTLLHNATRDMAAWKQKRPDANATTVAQEIEILARAGSFHSEMCLHFGAVRALCLALADAIAEVNQTMLDGLVILDDAHKYAGAPFGEWLSITNMITNAKLSLEEFRAPENTKERAKLEDLFRNWNPSEDT